MQASASWVSKNILLHVISNNNMTPDEEISLMNQKYRLDITYNNAWRPIGMEKETLSGKVEESYEFVEDMSDV